MSVDMPEIWFVIQVLKGTIEIHSCKAFSSYSEAQEFAIFEVEYISNINVAICRATHLATRNMELIRRTD